jgi:hypothetical protein
VGYGHAPIHTGLVARGAAFATLVSPPGIEPGTVGFVDRCLDFHQDEEGREPARVAGQPALWPAEEAGELVTRA